ncbi:DUF2199 domain-containing protein [Epilithonimonas sp.]|uniref:DUF2199 domain-containing protein n=1 Tax=Epilithonimonas sp. TaxID=2894511 RepID=UPI00289801F2|nr:DUF2199 domain-containing protein [Epilithonimonas sp.]
MKLFKLKNKENKFKCNCCGKIYDNIPMTFGNDYPAFYYSIPDDEIENRIEYQKSLCVIDEKYFFHRVRLEIPILDYSENLNFDIWTTISEENFIKRNDDWNNSERTDNEPYFGWLENEIPTYFDTFHLETISRENEVGLIPSLEIIDENHPLYFDQQNGITLEKAQKIVQNILEKQHN